jgi:hypothetical protein
MSALRRWLREERARVFKAGWDADRRERELFLGCVCELGPCYCSPCASRGREESAPPSHDGEKLGPAWWENDEPAVFSNVPTHGPLTAEHLQRFAADVRAMAGKPMPLPPSDPVPSWVLDMAVEEGWVDAGGNFTEKYWKDFRELNQKGSP